MYLSLIDSFSPHRSPALASFSFCKLSSLSPRLCSTHFPPPPVLCMPPPSLLPLYCFTLSRKYSYSRSLFTSSSLYRKVLASCFSVQSAARARRDGDSRRNEATIRNAFLDAFQPSGQKGLINNPRSLCPSQLSTWTDPRRDARYVLSTRTGLVRIRRTLDKLP